MKAFKILIIIIFNINTSNAIPTIVTTNVPIASMVYMLVQNHANIVYINTDNTCTHQYHLKHNDLLKLKNADFYIYIDEFFDKFMFKSSNMNDNNSIQISDSLQSHILVNNGFKNYHFWLDLTSVEIVLNAISKKLLINFPYLKNILIDSVKKATSDIENLKKFKAYTLSKMNHIILLSDSLEYFFIDTNINVYKFFYIYYPSIQMINDIKRLLSLYPDIYVLLSSDQPINSYKKITDRVLSLNSENWALNSLELTNNSFIKNYKELIHKISYYCK